MRKILLPFVVLAALVFGALPAHAASHYEFTDPGGDADCVSSVCGVAPSQDQFDITKVSLDSDGKSLVYAATLKDVSAGEPDESTGYYFRLAFSYGGKGFWFIVAEDVYGGKTASIRPQDTTDTTKPDCVKCTGTIDRKKKQVIVTAPIASIAAALKADDKTLPPLGPGSEITDLDVLSQRQVGGPSAGSTLTADEATAPTGYAFKL